MPSVEVMLLGGLVVVLVTALIVGAILVLKSNRSLVELILDDRQRTIDRRDGARIQEAENKKLKRELSFLRDAMHQQAREADGGQLSAILAEDRRRHDPAEEVSEADIGTAGRRISRRMG